MGLAQEMQRFFDSWDDYDADIARSGWIVPDQLAIATMPYLNGCKCALDAGCGTGVLGRELRRAGYRGTLVGVDIAGQRLAQAKERCFAGHPIYNRTLRANLHRLPWRVPRFDAVLSSGVLGLSGPSTVHNLLRVTRNNGVLALEVGRYSKEERKRRCDAIFRLLKRLEGNRLEQLLFKNLGTGYTGARYHEHHWLFIYRKIA